MCGLLALAGLTLALGVCPRSRHVDLRLGAAHAPRASVLAMSSAHDVLSRRLHDLPALAGARLVFKLAARFPRYRAQGLRMRPFPVVVAGPSVSSAGFGVSGEF